MEEAECLEGVARDPSTGLKRGVAARESPVEGGSSSGQSYTSARKKARKTVDHIDLTDDTPEEDSTMIEGSSWQPFYLTSVAGIDAVHNRCSLTITDLFSYEADNPITSVCLMNYMVDLHWLAFCCPWLQEFPLLCLHGSTAASDNPRWTVCSVDMGEERYGTHHSKIAIVFYRRGLRIVITTANFIEDDFTYRTQGVYVQDFPLKGTTISTSEFEASLLEYLRRISVSGFKGGQKLYSVILELSKYDYSEAEVVLVASVPGRHNNSNIEKWGIGKLVKELDKAGLLDERYVEEGYKLVMQYSSLGSMGKDAKLVDDYACRMIFGSNGSQSRHRSFDFNMFVDIVWPTVNCVKNSFQVRGASIFASTFYETDSIVVSRDTSRATLCHAVKNIYSTNITRSRRDFFIS